MRRFSPLAPHTCSDDYDRCERGSSYCKQLDDLRKTWLPNSDHQPNFYTSPRIIWARVCEENCIILHCLYTTQLMLMMNDMILFDGIFFNLRKFVSFDASPSPTRGFALGALEPRPHWEPSHQTLPLSISSRYGTPMWASLSWKAIYSSLLYLIYPPLPFAENKSHTFHISFLCKYVRIICHQSAWLLWSLWIGC